MRLARFGVGASSKWRANAFHRRQRFGRNPRRGRACSLACLVYQIVMNAMKPLPLCLRPGQDLRAALEAAVLAQNCCAACVLSGGMEILALSGTVAAGGDKTASHMHIAISTATGQVLGGHVAPGCIVLTTAGVLRALLLDWQFTREPDAQTGYDELVVRAQS